MILHIFRYEQHNSLIVPDIPAFPDTAFGEGFFGDLYQKQTLIYLNLLQLYMLQAFLRYIQLHTPHVFQALLQEIQGPRRSSSL